MIRKVAPLAFSDETQFATSSLSCRRRLVDLKGRVDPAVGLRAARTIGPGTLGAPTSARIDDDPLGTLRS